MHSIKCPACSFVQTLLHLHMRYGIMGVILRCVICRTDDKLPKTATNPEYFASDKSKSKSPRHDYYNAPPAPGGASVSRTGSRFINESRV